MGMLLGPGAADQLTRLMADAAAAKAFSDYFKRYYPTKEDALKNYRFGEIVRRGAVTFDSATSATQYLYQDVTGLSADVKAVFERTLVENLFEEAPSPMKFQVKSGDEGTDVPGGEISVGFQSPYILVTIICERKTAQG